MQCELQVLAPFETVFLSLSWEQPEIGGYHSRSSVERVTHVTGGDAREKRSCMEGGTAGRVNTTKGGIEAMSSCALPKPAFRESLDSSRRLRGGLLEGLTYQKHTQR